MKYDAAHGLVRMVRLTKNEASMCQFVHKRKWRSSFPRPIIGKAPDSHSEPFPTLSVLRSAAASKRQGRSLGDGSPYYPARSNDYRNGPFIGQSGSCSCCGSRIRMGCNVTRLRSCIWNQIHDQTRPLTRFLPDRPGY